MKKISIIILPIIVCACMANNRNEIPDGIEIIPVEVNKLSENTSSFLEKIELVPLETNDSS